MERQSVFKEKKKSNEVSIHVSIKVSIAVYILFSNDNIYPSFLDIFLRKKREE